MMFYNRADVDNLIREHDTRDPFQLCKDLGVTVWYNDDLEYLKGFYLCAEGYPYIVLNGNLDENLTKMVLAHELGHDRMHRDKACIAPMQDFSIFDTSKEECEANSFAADLLIRDDDILELMNSGTDFASIYRTLECHAQLVLFKLCNLKREGHKLNIPDIPNSAFLG